jgi:hypothetical protein
VASQQNMVITMMPVHIHILNKLKLIFLMQLEKNKDTLRKMFEEAENINLKFGKVFEAASMIPSNISFTKFSFCNSIYELVFLYDYRYNYSFSGVVCTILKNKNTYSIEDLIEFLYSGIDYKHQLLNFKRDGLIDIEIYAEMIFSYLLPFLNKVDSIDEEGLKKYIAKKYSPYM